MSTSLEGISVKITLELQGFFETPVPLVINSLTVGSGVELNQTFSSRILSDTDGNGTIEPVQGPNGLLTGTLTLDISGNQVFAQFSGTAQPAGIKLTIENLAPSGAAPGTIQEAGEMSGVNIVNAPTYTAATKTLELNWTLLGFQPGTTINQTVFYDNLLEDPPVAVDDSFAVNVGQTLSGANLLTNDTDLDNLGAFGVVDIPSVTQINGQTLDPNAWINLAGGGQVKVSSTGAVQFNEDGDFADLIRGATRSTSFQYTVSDSTGRTDVGTATIVVTGVNSAPTITLPTTASFLENAGATGVSGIALADLDADNQSVSLSVGSGAISLGTSTGLTFTDADGSNGSLSFSGSLANVNAALASLAFAPQANFTGSTTLSLSTNDGLATRSSSLALSVTDVDPSLAPQTVTIAENLVNGSQVATLAATGDTNGLTYSIISGNGAGAFAINATTGVITVADATKLDFETASSFTLGIAVDDEDAGATADATTTVAISLTDENEAPTGITLSTAVVPESLALSGALVGPLTGIDPDAGDTLTFGLVAGAGDTHNAKFAIDGTDLKLASDLSAGTYSLRLSVTDAAGLSFSRSLTVTVADNVKPVITSVTGPNTPLGIGDTLTITVQAGEAGLTLEQGTVNGRPVTSFLDLGAGEYSAVYTVSEGDTDVAAGADIPISIQLKDAAGNVSDAFTTGIVNSDDVIDAERPSGSVPVLTSSSDTGLLATDGITKETVLAFTGTGENGATVELLNASDQVLGSGTITGASWNVTASALAEGTHQVRARYTDAVGNTFISSASTITIDTTAPAAVSDAVAIDLRSVAPSLPNVLLNDTGATAITAVEGSAAKVGVATTGSAGGSFVLNSDGSIVFDPAASFAALKSGETAQTTLDYVVTDEAGNLATSSITVTLTGRNDAPVMTTKAGSTVTVGSTVTLTSSVLQASDVDDAADGITFTLTSSPINGVLRLGGADLALGATFTQDDVNQGRLTYRAGSTVGQESFEFSIADGGEDGAAALTGQTFVLTVQPEPEVPSQPTETTKTDVIDGVNVTTSTKTDSNGNQTQTITIPTVSETAPEPVEIPIVKSPSGEVALSVEVPAGVGLTVSGSPTPTTGQASTTQFTAQLETQTPGTNSKLAEGGKAFIESLPPNTPVIVQTIVPTISTGSAAPSGPIVISGSTGGAGTASILIVDTSNLPSGTVIQFQNVSFAAVVGNVSITGGEGSQVVYADGGSQFIVLGPDDDELHGGPGDDTIGSAGGNDRLFGDEGNDLLFGGAGDDALDGGTGTDTASFVGLRSEYRVTQDGTGFVVEDLIPDRDGKDTIINFELLKFSDQTIAPVADLPFSALFAANLAQGQAFASAYQLLLGGVPGTTGFEFLIKNNLATNFGAGPGLLFNAENTFINIVNALVQGNTAASAAFSAIANGATLVDKVASIYAAVVPAAQQHVEGLAFLTRPEALTFFQEVAVARGVATDNGAAIAALASLLKIAVDEQIGIGNAASDLAKALAAGSALLPDRSVELLSLEAVDGAQFDGDDAVFAPPPPAGETALIGTLAETPGALAIA